MTCTICQETYHNKLSCNKEPVSKPPKVNRPLVPKPHEYRTYASARGRGSNMGESSATIGESSSTMKGQGNDGMGESGRPGERSQRIQKSVAANTSDKGEIGFRLCDFEAEDNYKSNAELEIPSADPIVAVTPSADKGKQLA
nr:hypothetical protein [Tanacetum cinerariifolium]